MTKLKLLAAAAVVTSLVASPVMAKDTPHQSGQKSVKVQKANKQARMQQRSDRMAGYDRVYNNDGFLPGAVVGGIVGGAVSTAGAIATAPFRDDYAYDTSYDDTYGYTRGPAYREYDGFATTPFRDTYASAPVYRANNWDNGWNDTSWNNGWAGQSYAKRNGFVCTPGTMFVNENGRTQLCQ